MIVAPVAAGNAGAAGADPALARALADELVALTGLMCELADDLPSDPETVRRHMVGLQAIDRIVQTQLAMAGILRSGDTAAERLEAVTLESLARSLKAGYVSHLGCGQR